MPEQTAPGAGGAGAARQALLDKIIVHVGEHGMSDASLRELAESVGSSHRMLLYHFGSRAGLVAAIVETIEAQQREALRVIADDATSTREIVTTQWAQLADPALAPFIRLFFEVTAASMFERPGTEGFLDQLTEPWIELGIELADRVRATGSPVDIRLGIAVLRGLLLDAVASGDYEAAEDSLHRFLQMWEAAPGRVVEPG